MKDMVTSKKIKSNKNVSNVLSDKCRSFKKLVGHSSTECCAYTNHDCNPSLGAYVPMYYNVSPQKYHNNNE